MLYVSLNIQHIFRLTNRTPFQIVGSDIFIDHLGVRMCYFRGVDVEIDFSCLVLISDPKIIQGQRGMPRKYDKTA